MEPEYSERLSAIKTVLSHPGNTFTKTKRLFLEEPSHSTKGKRDEEFQIKSEVAALFKVPYAVVLFCGSAHLGISPVKGTLFEPGKSDLDLAIVSPTAFTEAFEDLAASVRGFSDLTAFSHDRGAAEFVKQRIWKRGSIHLKEMPNTKWTNEKKAALRDIEKKYRPTFRSITVAFYISEYFYCWKQKSSISGLIGLGS